MMTGSAYPRKRATTEYTTADEIVFDPETHLIAIWHDSVTVQHLYGTFDVASAIAEAAYGLVYRGWDRERGREHPGIYRWTRARSD